MIKILFYVNSFFGTGHFCRIYNIITALRYKHPDIQLTILYSGVPCDLFFNNDRCKAIHLPSFTYWGETLFDNPFWEDLEIDKHRLFEKRKQIIKDLLSSIHFDAIVTEYLPFSKFELIDELLIIFDGFRAKSRHGHIISSVRDIITYDAEQKKTITEQLINAYYSTILVHSDPRIIKFNQSYGNTSAIEAKLVYTGFVTSCYDFSKQKHKHKKKRIVISVGGGHDGFSAIRIAIEAIKNLNDIVMEQITVDLFVGKYFPDKYRSILNTNINQIRKNDILRIRQSEEYYNYRDMADISISMCGYNTCYELLVRGITSIFIPRARQEQTLRAEILSKLGVSRHVTSTQSLTEILTSYVLGDTARFQIADFCFNGANNTAKYLYSLIK